MMWNIRKKKSNTKKKIIAEDIGVFKTFGNFLIILEFGGIPYNL
jgi:hypothetical protein